MLHRFSLQSARSRCHFTALEIRGPNFVSTMSRTIKCNHCSKLFVNQHGSFYTVKLKTYNCIVFADVSTHKIISFQNLSLGFILKRFLKFREFQPRYSYKKKSVHKKRSGNGVNLPGLLTKLLRSGCMSISKVLFFWRVYGPIRNPPI